MERHGGGRPEERRVEYAGIKHAHETVQQAGQVISISWNKERA
jgi:hypothetical protein